ncbi:MAG: glycosyltransferase family 2 protein [Treponema sp.]|nr:glycosyltransferase family 2 protein [Treponema sp.]
MKAAFIIPVYNHGSTLKGVVQSLLQYKLPVIVVDDGNDALQKSLIATVVQDYPNDVILVNRNKNGGKGRAMNDGVRKACELGFSHVFQIDADGQHDVSACGLFLQEAEKTPDDIICGYPVYDDSVPESRRKGREFSNIWARFVTLNSDIKDVLCGFRVYPVQPYMELLNHHAVINSHMGYDTDILVHLSWKGLKIRSFGVHVTYPADGISNFRMVRDNMHISATYTRLCAGMIVRLPLLIYRKCAKKIK